MSLNPSENLANRAFVREASKRERAEAAVKRSQATMERFRGTANQTADSFVKSFEADLVAVVPGMAEYAEIASGVASGALQSVDGNVATLLHPVEALKNFGRLVSHVPASPLWLARAWQGGAKGAWIEDQAYWKQWAKVQWQPVQAEIAAGRPLAAAGRAVFDVVSTVSGLNAKRAFLARVGEGAASARAARTVAGSLPKA